MKAQHTPGPYYVASTGNHQALVIAEQTGANIAVAYDKKDAPWLAVAPELLDALRDSLSLLIGQFPDGTNTSCVQRTIDAARAAIAEATGEPTPGKRATE